MLLRKNWPVFLIFLLSFQSVYNIHREMGIEREQKEKRNKNANLLYSFAMKSWKSHAQCFPRDKQDKRNWFSSLNSFSVLMLCLYVATASGTAAAENFVARFIIVLTFRLRIKIQLYANANACIHVFVCANINEHTWVFFFHWCHYYCCCCQNEFEIFSSLNEQTHAK